MRGVLKEPCRALAVSSKLSKLVPVPELLGVVPMAALYLAVLFRVSGGRM
jgi:hypothetical protein